MSDHQTAIEDASVADAVRPAERIVVVGGGIVGLSTAYYLARRGAAVTVVDRDAVQDSASSGNAGLIAIGHPPMPRPGLVSKTVRMLLDPTGPLYIAPRLDWELVKWFWGFRRACGQRHFDASMRLLGKLGWATKACFDELVEDEGLECEYEPAGWMEIFRTPAAREALLREVELQDRYGYTIDLLDGDELRRREPAYKPDVLGAAHYTDGAFANPGRFLQGLQRRVGELGVEVLTETEAERLIVEDGRFRALRTSDGEVIEASTVVLAAGSWTTELARSIGVRVPMQPGKGYHLNVTGPTTPVRTAAVLRETFVAVTPMDGGLRLAGTVELSGMNDRIVQRRLDMLLIGARQYIDGMGQATERSRWCGLRPCTADGLPIVGWAPEVDGVFVATGHAMMGFCLGPITGRLTAEMLLDGAPSIDVGRLSPARYRGGRPARRPVAARA